MQKPWVRAVLTVLVLSLMAVIFWYSGRPGDESEAQSKSVTMNVIESSQSLQQQYKAKDGAGKFEFVYLDWMPLIRKAAHVLEFAALAFLIRLCLESWMGRRKDLWIFALLITVDYGALDEIHQIFVAGRSALAEDVLIDAGGAVLGTLAAGLVSLLIFRIAKRSAERK